MGHFQVKSNKKLSEMKIGDRLEESDYATLTPDGNFVQLEYIEEDSVIEKYDVKPGIYVIKKTTQGMKLEPTEFLQDKLLKSFISTKDITDKIDCFFRKFDVYKQLKTDVPVRRMMLYGPPGVGKSTAINDVAMTYTKDNKTTVIVWPTDKYESWEVKDFLHRLNYIGVEKQFLIMEDLGGIEMDQVRLKSDSSLLSMLTNQDKTFTIPTLVLATTNHIEVFMGNLTNRPGRFDDKIEIGFPPKEFRQDLLKFFAISEVSEDALKLVGSNACKEFSTAHLKEIVIRSALYDKDMITVIKELINEIESFTKEFTKKKRMGLSEDDY